MKKSFLFIMVAMIGFVASAGDGDYTKEQYMSMRKAAAEKAGLEFDEAKSEAIFAKRDLNKDGVVDEAERAKLREAKKKA